ncbi:MAG: PAS domain-containing protein [Deltaproteobacteria bacterium]|nr:PAS domain-containing protein [Deltaproteobacteria bacterium]
MDHPVDLLFVVAFLNASLAGLALWRSDARVARLFALTNLLAATWSLSYRQELMAHGLDQKIFWVQFKYVFLLFLPPVHMAMVREFTGQLRWLRGRAWLLVFAFPIASLPVVLTMREHPWFRHSFQLESVAGLEVLTFKWGPWGYALILVGTAWSVASLVMLAAAWWSAAPIVRKQVGLMFWACLVPVGVDGLFLAGFSPLRGINFSQVSLLMTAAAWAWALFGHRSLNLVPLARGTVLDQMPSLVFVVDASGRLADINQTMLRKIGLGAAQVVDRLPAEVLAPPWRVLAELPGEFQGAIRLGEGAQASWYERTVTPLRDSSGSLLGTLITCHDVTHRVRAERARDDEKALLGLVINSVSEAVILLDERGTPLAVNDPALRLFGAADVATLATHVAADLLPPSPVADCGWRAIGPGDELDFERRLEPRPGCAFDARVFLHGVTRDGHRLIVATVQDISDRVRREQVEREAERLRNERREFQRQQRLIRDLHDGIGGITANIGMIATLGDQARVCVAKECLLNRITALAAEGSGELRLLMNAMECREMPWPSLLAELRRLGVMLLEDHGIAFSFSANGDPPACGPGVFPGMSLTRVFKEAVHNVAKHASASRVEVRVTFAGDQVELRVRDNGRGLPVPSQPGRGLGNMRRRIEEMSGEMHVRSSGEGTELVFTLPQRPELDAAEDDSRRMQHARMEARPPP